MPPRVVLIHAMLPSIAPITAAFHSLYPSATLLHLLDTSLSLDLAAGTLTPALHRRVLSLASHAVENMDADAILFTCSAFGPAIDAAKRRHPDVPILKPSEGLLAAALAAAKPVGLVATFPATLLTMPGEFAPGVLMGYELAEGALEALERGDVGLHDARVAAAAGRLVARGAEVVALAQFSAARARGRVEEATGKRVLTTVESAVEALKSAVAARVAGLAGVAAAWRG